MSTRPSAAQRAAAVAQGRTDIWTPPKPRRAATVAILRDADDGLEVYLIKRAAAMNFAAVTAYPGGAVETEDGPAEHPQTLRKAAVREVWEETGVRLETSAVLPFARWITPEPLPVRFDTEFFATALPPGDEPELRGTEAEQGGWLNPGRLLQNRGGNRNELGASLLPPTLATLYQLAQYESVDTALSGLASLPVVPLLPVPVMAADDVQWQLLDAGANAVVTDPTAVGIPEQWRLELGGGRP